MAECSTDGYYTLLGRKSDLIISGGFNIYPREIARLRISSPNKKKWPTRLSLAFPTTCAEGGILRPPPTWKLAVASFLPPPRCRAAFFAWTVFRERLLARSRSTCCRS
jgi:acyl-CoA synthetase (AMP-forming)/AMP-acid ligase II